MGSRRQQQHPLVVDVLDRADIVRIDEHLRGERRHREPQHAGRRGRLRIRASGVRRRGHVAEVRSSVSTGKAAHESAEGLMKARPERLATWNTEQIARRIEAIHRHERKSRRQAADWLRRRLLKRQHGGWRHRRPHRRCTALRSGGRCRRDHRRWRRRRDRPSRNRSLRGSSSRQRDDEGDDQITHGSARTYRISFVDAALT